MHLQWEREAGAVGMGELSHGEKAQLGTAFACLDFPSQLPLEVFFLRLFILFLGDLT